MAYIAVTALAPGLMLVDAGDVDMAWVHLPPYNVNVNEADWTGCVLGRALVG